MFVSNQLHRGAIGVSSPTVGNHTALAPERKQGRKDTIWSVAVKAFQEPQTRKIYIRPINHLIETEIGICNTRKVAASEAHQIDIVKIDFTQLREIGEG